MLTPYRFRSFFLKLFKCWGCWGGRVKFSSESFGLSTFFSFEFCLSNARTGPPCLSPHTAQGDIESSIYSYLDIDRLCLNGVLREIVSLSYIIRLRLHEVIVGMLRNMASFSRKAPDSHTEGITMFFGEHLLGIISTSRTKYVMALLQAVSSLKTWTSHGDERRVVLFSGTNAVFLLR